VTAKARVNAPASAAATVDAPAYIVVLARILVDAALRELRDEAPANDNEPTLVDREDA
jgi:hypothetical protein